MTWASRRRFFILSIILGIIAALFGLLFLAFFRTPPSCSDGVQNQNEAGIDCGGPCPYLCTAEELPPTILFTKTIPNGTGRTDIAASIENMNPTAAAKSVPYTLSLYGVGQVLMQQITGTIDLPPFATVPVFVPGIADGSQKIVSAFLTIDPTAPKWFTLATDPRILPVVSNISLGGTPTAPRISATLSNATITEITNVPVIAFVHDDKGDVIAASQTLLPRIPAQGQTTAVFTWGGAFVGTPAAIEVIPVIPLP